MKRIIKSGLILFATIIGLSSCLEDKGYTDIINAVGAEPIVSIFGNAGGSLQTGKFKIDTLVDVTYKVNLGSVNTLDKDLALTMGVTTAATDFLKATNATRAAAGDDPYVALPTSAYTFVNPVIKAGTRDADFTVKVKLPKTLDLSKEYVIPVGITDASGVKISSNLGFMNIFVGGTPNQYDGTYQSTGYFSHPSAPRAINREKHLATIDKNTSETEFADLGYIMWLKVNKDNTVTIIPKGAAADLAGPFEQTGVNKYDPATKTFTLNYQYNVGTRVITETIKKN
ncbi:BT_3044 domain-containing protein [Arcicella rigui]|uniref:DUF4361 domain-containing protein n=1 Tax=Arcicella rigui TaxID=797020 RepID=A0ABU5Q6V3_9BACT|nr:DUF4361 domain-containing protein [Arcicella rigui]MEA5138327.1 DUF4361 domain-containing protein [Arcicella rigui]